MKSVSFLRSWKRRDSKSPKMAFDEDDHLPLQYPTELVKETASSRSGAPSHSPGPSSVQAPLLLLSSHGLGEDFSSPVEEAMQYRRRMEQRASASHRTTPQHHDASRVIFYPNPSSTGLNNGIPSQTHGPPRNAKHGPRSILQSQLSVINSSKPVPNTLFTTCQSEPLRSQNHQSTEVMAIKSRSPTRVKFGTSVQILGTSPQHSKISFASASSTDDSLVKSRRDAQGAWVTEIACSELSDGVEGPSQRRDSALSRKVPNQPPVLSGRSGLLGDTSENPSRRTLNSTRSTPHLRPTGEFFHNNNNPLPPLPAELPSPSDTDFTSLFPSPPPLNIRKKRPQPLVLHPKGASQPLPPSPSPSSTDSTFVATPQSTTYGFPTHVPTCTKSPLGRKGTVIPPMLHNAPTSPLPSPPNVLPATPPNYALPRQTTQSLGHLKFSRSTSNLRMDRTPSGGPTHRMTSSDPIAEVAGQPTKHRITSPLKLDPNTNNVRNSTRRVDRREEVVPSPQEGTVQWGYAL